MKLLAILPLAAVLVAASAALAAAPGVPVLKLSSKAAPKDGDKVELVGKVATGVMAIGGETTGTTFTVSESKLPDVTYELDLHGDKALTKAVEGLNGKQAQVNGTLTIKDGVEVGKRTIIVVEKIVAAK